MGDFCVICNIERIIMSFLNAFIGVPQSRYAAFAVLTAILVVSLTILFGNEAVPLSQKFAFIFMLFLVSLPGILLSLFQLTCIVVGAGVKNQRPWCSIYAWIISILLIVYCALLIVLAVVALTGKSKAMGEVAMADAEKFVGSNPSMTMDEANKIATQMFANEKFATATTSAPKQPEDTNVPPLKEETPKPVMTAPPSKFTVKPTQHFEGGVKLNSVKPDGFQSLPTPKNTFATQHFANAPMVTKPAQFGTEHFAAPPTKPAQFGTEHFAAPPKFTNDRINGQSSIYGTDTVEPFDGGAASYSMAPQKFGMKQALNLKA